MQTWYYSSNGERQGPVSFEDLKALARRGGIDPVKDLAWSEGMSDWTPSGQVSGLFSDVSPASDGALNPYAIPSTASNNLLAPFTPGALGEIPPGSADLPIMEVLKRSFLLTKRNFGNLLGIGFVYIVVSFGIQFVLTLLDKSLGMGSEVVQRFPGGGMVSTHQLSFGVGLLSMFPTCYLLAGINRILLNLGSGDQARLEMLFSQGAKTLRMVGGMLLFYLVVVLGLILFIVPGVYLALRFGYFQYAIVDRNLGIIDAFKYSSELTKNNRLNLLGLFVIMFFVMIAGALALVIGLIFALPLVAMMLPVAYRFLQFGGAALRDDEDSKVPLLQGRCPQQ